MYNNKDDPPSSRAKRNSPRKIILYITVIVKFSDDIKL